MELTALLRLFKGATPMDFIMYTIVTFLAVRAGIVEWKGKKKDNKHTARHVALVADIDKIITDKMIIMYYKTMREQMRICESAIDSVLRIMRDYFFQTLKGKGYTSTQILETVDIKLYNATVEILASRARMDLRTMMRENGLSDKSELEMQVYTNGKVEVLIETGRVVFDTYYSGSDLIISRADLHELHKELYPKIKQKFTETMRECRDIAIRADGKVELLDQQLEELRNNPCSIGD